MKTLRALILALFIALFSGCSWMVNDRIILMPQNQYYPTFPIEEFQKAEKCEYDLWEETDNNNTYAVSYMKPAMKCLKENKQNRSDLNLLIKKVKDFNVKIHNLNKIQSEKEPHEVK